MAIQLKRSVSSQIDPNYVLAQGQVGIEMPGASNTADAPFRLKIGDGTSIWASLPYFGESAEVDLSSVVPTSRTINMHPLTSDVTLTASDVGAATASHTHSEYLTTSGTAAAATKLATARTIRTNLGSTSTASFNGTANITPGVSGTLPVTNGGTGVTSIDALKTALGVSSNSSLIATEAGTFSDGSNKQSNFVIAYDSTSEHQTLNLKLGKISDTTIRGSSWMYVTSERIVLTGTGSNGVSLRSNFVDTTYAVELKPVQMSQLEEAFYPTISIALGTPNLKWKTVYATTGAIQTSDRQSKYHISYLSQSNVAQADDTSPTGYNPDLSTVLQFIQNMDPATFCYKNSQTESTENAKQANPEDIQLGLIADDIESDPIFPYIGAKYTWEASDAIFDNQGHEIEPAREAGSALALKPIPLAVAALTACKYLLQRVELLEEQHDS